MFYNNAADGASSGIIHRSYIQCTHQLHPRSTVNGMSAEADIRGLYPDGSTDGSHANGRRESHTLATNVPDTVVVLEKAAPYEFQAVKRID